MKRLVSISVPDFISNTMFPVLAAKELRLFEDEGLDVEVQLLTGFRAIQALRVGAVDFYASTAEEPLAVFPNWDGAKLLAALAHGTPYLLVMRADLADGRNDLQVLSERSTDWGRPGAGASAQASSPAGRNRLGKGANRDRTHPRNEWARRIDRRHRRPSAG